MRAGVPPSGTEKVSYGGRSRIACLHISRFRCGTRRRDIEYKELYMGGVVGSGWNGRRQHSREHISSFVYVLSTTHTHARRLRRGSHKHIATYSLGETPRAHKMRTFSRRARVNAILPYIYFKYRSVRSFYCIIHCCAHIFECSCASVSLASSLPSSSRSSRYCCRSSMILKRTQS